MKKHLVAVIAMVLAAVTVLSAGSTTRTFAAAADAASDDKYANWPEKDITVIIQSKAGSGGDNFLRNIAMCLDGTDVLNGHSIKVENIIDNTGYTPWSQVRDSEPDGYTLAFLSPTIVNSDVINNTGLKYTDMTYICSMGGDPQYFVCKTGQPYNNLEEMLEYAKDHVINIGVGSTSGQNLVVALALQKLAGVQFNLITYTSGSDRVVSLLGDFTDVIITEYPDIAAQYEAGDLKLIANSGSHRTMPEIATLAESGYDIAVDRPRGLAGPKDMDPELAEKICDIFEVAFNSDHWQEFMEQNYTDPQFLRTTEFEDAYAVLGDTLLQYIDMMQ